jgi:D-alanine transaminase
MSETLLAYVNGRFLPQDQASLPITDRGLLFGDSVYEVIPAYGALPFRTEHHLRRLDRSLKAIHMANPLTDDQWHAVFKRLAQQLPGRDQSIYLQVTRGDHPVRNHVIPDGITPNVVAFTTPLPPRDPAKAWQGIRAITLEDIRWHRCDIKATTLLANVLARARATEEGADEAILIREGMAMEGTASNLFIVSNGLLITPPDNDELLSGITRDLVLELAADDGIPYAQATVGADQLQGADEIWLTSSTREVAAVVELNGQAVGSGAPGPLWQRMDALYQACKERLRLGEECRDEG